MAPTLLDVFGVLASKQVKKPMAPTLLDVFGVLAPPASGGLVRAGSASGLPAGQAAAWAVPPP